MDFGSFAELAFDFKVPLHGFDDIQDDAQSQAGTAGSICGISP